MSSIYTNIRSPDLFSGSADVFRTKVGGYWHTVATDGGSTVDFKSTSDTAPDYSKLQRIFTDIENAHTIEEKVVVPNKMFPVRVVGSADNNKNDEDWRAVWTGGTYGDEEYTALYQQSVFRYYNISIDKPYTKLQSAILSGEYNSSLVSVAAASRTIEIGYDYTQYLPQYQNTIDDYTSELLIPNFYMMKDLSRWDFSKNELAKQAYPTELVNFISREGMYESVGALFDYNADGMPSPLDIAHIDTWSEIRQKHTNLTREYLTSSLFQQPLSASTVEWAKAKQQNILFDYEEMDKLSELDSYQDCLPFKIKINFAGYAMEEFGQTIKDSKFGPKFIKTLYEAYSGQIPDLAPQDVSCVTSMNYYSGSSAGVDEVDSTSTVSYREIDYFDLLTYSYYNYAGSDANCMFIGENNAYRAAAIEPTPIYRHINTIAASKVMNHAVEYLQNESNVNVNEWNDLFSETERHSEVIAYRVEKIGGPATGDSNTQNVLQNFWFSNAHTSETFEFFDNQVNYNTDYTYKVYAYVLAVGIEYKYSDLLLSRNLGADIASTGPFGLVVMDYESLELYNPFNNDERAEELYDSSLSTLLFSNKAGGETYGTTAQIFSSYPYVADFNLRYQTKIKIVEIPLYSKTLRILDNPSAKLNVRPYQVINSSKKIGFDLSVNTFQETSFPQIISSDDALYKARYLHANDLIDTSNISLNSVAQPRYMDVYRLEERPTAIGDFDGALIQTLELKIKDDSTYTYNRAFFEDAIKTNTKYYYLFRVRNQQRVLSHLTDVYECELISDGGYNYTIFNVLFESELEQKVFSNPAKEFKKLFQLQPNMSQLTLDATGVDFQQSAKSQLDNLVIGTADDLIWDKTFKIRLTSKKTGRKIDLNITYNLSSE